MRTALITGGAKGIGAAVARKLAADGMNVVIAYRNSKGQATQLADELNGRVRALAVACDVTDAKQVQALYRECRSAFGTVDTLINNAGVSLYKLLQDTTDADYDAVMNANCRGAFLTTRAFLPDMIAGRFGRIVNISSMWGVTGAAMETVYSMSKAAVIGLTKALAKEVGPSGVTVNAVAPGAIETDMLGGFSAQDLDALCDETPLGRIGKPTDIAAAVSYLASADSFVTGTVLHVNGGLVI